MNSHDDLQRPHTLAQVARMSESLADFGASLRDWQHHIQRGGVNSRKGLANCIAEAPPSLKSRFKGGDVADAYLAAYAEWLADQAGIGRPEWCHDSARIAESPWFATSLRGHLLAASPAAFRQRQLFTIPDNIFTPRAGRPRVSTARKREKARIRQKQYRCRINALLRQAAATVQCGEEIR